ncbi:hypothetical protein PENTCL1PPCAC_5645 [Pristionchus entomophagus]|uniref:BTB domain-containing protein n=1 Tax=Pristionchus entomophagus TaxID=358040 RepID=A0AAV5SLQ9_9BILA|nr:hypothetical protein PENTCL1PPCAC_5645 [Pristionchus entomophagus]
MEDSNGLRAFDPKSRATTSTSSCRVTLSGIEEETGNAKRTSNSSSSRRMATTFVRRFNDSESIREIERGSMSMLTEPGFGYIHNDKVVVEFHISIINSEGNYADLSKFSSLVDSSNVTLVIGDKKIPVFKEYLAMQSPVFNAMFYGNYAEKGKNEVPINDVVYEEFVCLLNGSRIAQCCIF